MAGAKWRFFPKLVFDLKKIIHRNDLGSEKIRKFLKEIKGVKCGCAEWRLLRDEEFTDENQIIFGF